MDITSSGTALPADQEERLKEVEQLTEYLNARLAGIGSYEYQQKDLSRTGSDHAELRDKLAHYERITGIPKQTKLHFVELKSAAEGLVGLATGSAILKPQEPLPMATRVAFREQAQAFVEQEQKALERYVIEGIEQKL